MKQLLVDLGGSRNIQMGTLKTDVGRFPCEQHLDMGQPL